MIEIGVYNKLLILRETSVGLYLGDGEGEDVLLPNKYCPEKGTYEFGDELEVFVYLDYAERKVATNLEPKIKLHEFALLEVASVQDVGAFMDWGLEKQLLVPFGEQRQRMEEGRWYIVYLDLDVETERLYATNRLNNILQNEIMDLRETEKVDLLVMKQTDLGYTVIVNNEHTGLVYDSDTDRELRVGERMDGYVKRIRPDNKLDISLRPMGYANTNDEYEEAIMDSLDFADGFLPYNDKSDPDDIRAQFDMSKKSFKKAIGGLYKKRMISIDKDGIRRT